jgi:hypothetical protein
MEDSIACQTDNLRLLRERAVRNTRAQVHLTHAVSWPDDCREMTAPAASASTQGHGSRPTGATTTVIPTAAPSRTLTAAHFGLPADVVTRTLPRYRPCLTCELATRNLDRVCEV